MALAIHEQVRLERRSVSRRRFLHHVSATAAASGLLSFPEAAALQADALRREGRALILLWMAGGPSQFESFDPKPGHENGGGTETISTAIPGVGIASGWPRMAEVLNDVAVIRSLTNREGNHPRASYQLHTGYLPSGSLKHPHFGSCAAQQLADRDAELPSVVSIGRTEGAGFLGVEFEPFVVDNPGRLPQNLGQSLTVDRSRRRIALLEQLEGEFASRGATQAVENHRQLYRKASRLVVSPATSAFNLDEEPAPVRERYGESAFGRGCLLARRLVEAGVTFVEVRSDGWDTHQDNTERVAGLARAVDPAAAALLTDLKARGLLEKTLVLWCGEFGRTPRINARGGRDHHPRSFSGWLAGGGVRGGQVIGATTPGGEAVADRPVSVPDLLCSLCAALGMDPHWENVSPLGRPLKVVEGGTVIAELGLPGTHSR